MGGWWGFWGWFKGLANLDKSASRRSVTGVSGCTREVEHGARASRRWKTRSRKRSKKVGQGWLDKGRKVELLVTATTARCTLPISGTPGSAPGEADGSQRHLIPARGHLSSAKVLSANILKRNNETVVPLAWLPTIVLPILSLLPSIPSPSPCPSSSSSMSD